MSFDVPAQQLATSSSGSGNHDSSYDPSDASDTSSSPSSSNDDDDDYNDDGDDGPWSWTLRRARSPLH